MTASLWSAWNTVAQPAVARLKPGECALLIILAASLLVLSVFRERYLAVWTAAWTLLSYITFGGETWRGNAYSSTLRSRG